ncbi:MAG: hypothetical protein LBI54_02395 [Lachnospiraceae bacterium]|jgi:glutamate--cysteine ligase|nr:hypothetical protein [Lachnospiraceae bacterium]
MVNNERLIQNYIDYFAAGCKISRDMKYGLEAEHFIVAGATWEAIPYSGENGVASFLQEMSRHFAHEYWEDGHLLGLYNDEAALSLEPGSQLEISIEASNDIAAMQKVYEKYRLLFDAALAARGQEIREDGYQPISRVADIELLPKKRYEFMDGHFRSTGTGGIEMMRGTASCQVALDYADETDFIAKYRCAYLLTPLLALLTDNSPRYEGRDYDRWLLRTDIWRRVDPARSGIVPSVFDPDFSFRKYAEYVLGQKAIFAVVDGIAEKSGKRVTEILAERTEWDEDHLLYLSLVFPDVRLRQYIEIRVADAMEPPQTFAYLALIKGLFTDIGGLREWAGKFPQSITAIEAAQDAIMANGWEATAYGTPVSELCQQMMALAAAQLDAGERAILQNGFGGL